MKDFLKKKNPSKFRPNGINHVEPKCDFVFLKEMNEKLHDSQDFLFC